MWNYLEDASNYQGHAEKILIPETEAELVGILAEAQASGTPVTIAGGGSGLTGGRVPEGGWSISLEKFNKMEIHEGRAVCGAGVILRDLHAAARRSGQFYPPDPTETMAAIGGTISCNACGSRSFMYGATRRWIERLRVALMDGRVLDLRRGDKIDFGVKPVHRPRSTKHSAGYPLEPGMDWIDLFTGSEGTLGVVIEAELKLLPLPKELLNGIVFFAKDEDAINAVEAWRSVEGLRMLEYADKPSLDLIREKYNDLPEKAAACVIVEQIVEDDSAVDAWVERLEAHHAMGEESWFGSNEADRERFRAFRHALPERVIQLVRQMGFPKLGSDFSVPVEKNREMLDYYRGQIAARFPAPHAIFGHIGDAHVHVNLFPASEELIAEGKKLMDDFARKSVELGGTVAAEHGLGKRKRHFLPFLYSEAEIEAMKDVKRLLDPKWLLGRGNLFPMSPEHP
ncbi:MAG: FAD-binding oxidoreductase [Acidobacteria bacterium]|nr:FAD-binding oxidoreductase [Acidobacteriota bacterium]